MTKRILEDVKVNVKIKLAGLWAAVMLLYLYGDVFAFFKPGVIEELIAGELAIGIPLTQVVLLGMAILMAIPGVMVFLSLILKAKANRWANIILGIVYTVVMLVSMFMPGTWVYYIFLGIVEIVLTVLIVRYAWKWPKQEG